MEQPDYSHDLPAGYRSWVDFDTDIEQHIARPDLVHDVYYYLSREGANVITMGELPDHRQLRYERAYVRRMAIKESIPYPTLAEGLPPGIKTWAELLASFGRQCENKYWIGARMHIPAGNQPPSTYLYTHHQVMQHVAEEQKAAEVEPFTVDELHTLRYLIQDYGRLMQGELDSVRDKVIRLLANAHEAKRLEHRYPQQIIDGRR